MKNFMGYLQNRIEAGRKNAAALEAEGRGDEADFEKVRINIYEVCKTVTNALISRPEYGPEAIAERFRGFKKTWSEALNKAREHGDARNVVIEETKLEALEDIIKHFAEVEK